MKLGEIAVVRTGLVLSRKQSEQLGGIPIKYGQLNLKSITSDGDIDTSLLDMYEAGETLRNEYVTHRNDIVIRLSSPYTAVLITDLTSNLVISSNFVIIRVDKKYLAPEYLYWLLNIDEIKKDIMQNLTGTMLGTVKPSYFTNLNIDVPPLARQHLIGNINLLAKQEARLLAELSEEKMKFYNIKMNQIKNNRLVRSNIGRKK